MKKLWIVIPAMAVSSIALAQPPHSCMMNANASTISFDLQKETTITAQDALVNVQINATVLQASDSQALQASTVSAMNALMPNVSWKVTNYAQQTAASGAQNIVIDLQTRLDSAQIAQLDAKLKASLPQNQTYKVQIVTFAPSLDKIQAAKNQMTIEMYQEVQEYIQNFNQQTNAQYQLKSIDYSTNTALPQRMMPTLMMARTNDSSADNMNVSMTLDMVAHITLRQNDTQPTNTQAMVGGKRVLPPAYLNVPNFQSCLQTESQGSWQSWCMPKTQPNDCPQSSWKELSTQNIPACQ